LTFNKKRGSNKSGPRSNELMIDIHDRMPMILSIEDEHNWLDKGRSVEDLKAMLQPFPIERMKAYPVSKVLPFLHLLTLEVDQLHLKK